MRVMRIGTLISTVVVVLLFGPLDGVLAARAQSQAQAPSSPPSQAAGRGRGAQGPPLLPTPPLTAAPTPEQDGNFVIGPPYEPAPELTVKEGVPQGTVREFTMD